MKTLQIFWPDGRGPEKSPVVVRGSDQEREETGKVVSVVPQMLWCDSCKKKADVSVRETGGGFVARCVDCGKWIKNISPRDMVRHGLTRGARVLSRRGKPLKPPKKDRQKKKKIALERQPPPDAEEKKKQENIQKQKVLQYRAMPYEEYLSTPHWKSIRTEAVQRACGKCQVCSSGTGLEVHHRTYENLGDEKPADLTVLCDKCHDLFHKNSRLCR